MLAKAKGYGRTVAAAVSDNFERAALGANWSVVAGSPAITASSDLGMTAFAGLHLVNWVGSPLPGLDQFVEVTYSADMTPEIAHQGFGRRRSSDLARYAFVWNGDPAFQANPFWDFKYDGVASGLTRQLGNLPDPVGPQPGDVTRIEIRGTSPVDLKGFINGKLVLSAQDDHADRIQIAGNVGMAYRANSGVTLTYPTKIFESFAAGTLLL